MSEFMSCTIQPDLEITPGSMAGDRRVVTIVFNAVTENVDQVDATWEILGPSDFKFGAPGPLDAHTRPTKLIAKRLYSRLPADGRYKLRIPIERDGKSLAEASLAIVATVVGIGQGQLPPVNARGRFAILTAGLAKVMADHTGEAVPAMGSKAFEEMARKFVGEMKDSPKLAKFTDFLKLPDETILRALMGANSQATTLEALDEVADQFMKGVKFPKDYKGGKGSMFTGLFKRVARLAV